MSKGVGGGLIQCDDMMYSWDAMRGCIRRCIARVHSEGSEGALKGCIERVHYRGAIRRCVLPRDEENFVRKPSSGRPNIDRSTPPPLRRQKRTVSHWKEACAVNEDGSPVPCRSDGCFCFWWRWRMRRMTGRRG